MKCEDDTASRSRKMNCQEKSGFFLGVGGVTINFWQTNRFVSKWVLVLVETTQKGCGSEHMCLRVLASLTVSVHGCVWVRVGEMRDRERRVLLLVFLFIS